MPIQHRLISDPEIHEPKGISTAPSNTVYHANGTGSGLWKAVDKNSLGIAGSSVGDYVTIGNGDTFSVRNDFAFGSMTFANNMVGYNFGSHAPIDSLERIWPIGGVGCPWQSLTTNTGVAVSDGILTASRAGLYRYDFIVTFLNWAPVDANNVIGPQVNFTASMHPARATIVGSTVGVAPDDELLSTATLSSFMQLGNGAVVRPCFNRYQANPVSLIVTSATVALTMIRGA